MEAVRVQRLERELAAARDENHVPVREELQGIWAGYQGGLEPDRGGIKDGASKSLGLPICSKRRRNCRTIFTSTRKSRVRWKRGEKWRWASFPSTGRRPSRWFLQA